MLGSLARMLRILGYYVIYGKYDDEELIEIASSRGAILFTRDVELSRRYSNSFLIKSSELDSQVREALSVLPDPDEEPFSICPLCGSPLLEAEREAIKLRVYEPVYSLNYSFYLCPKCGQVYWEGSQFRALKKRIKEILGETSLKSFPEVK